jgi:hypothetical protein
LINLASTEVLVFGYIAIQDIFLLALHALSLGLVRSGPCVVWIRFPLCRALEDSFIFAGYQSWRTKNHLQYYVSLSFNHMEKRVYSSSYHILFMGMGSRSTHGNHMASSAYTAFWLTRHTKGLLWLVRLDPSTWTHHGGMSKTTCSAQDCGSFNRKHWNFSAPTLYTKFRWFILPKRHDVVFCSSAELRGSRSQSRFTSQWPNLSWQGKKYYVFVEILEFLGSGKPDQLATKPLAALSVSVKNLHIPFLFHNHTLIFCLYIVYVFL